jgi:hypothetical protein
MRIAVVSLAAGVTARLQALVDRLIEGLSGLRLPPTLAGHL